MHMALFRHVGVNFKVWSQLKSEGAGGIELPKFEVKRGDFASYSTLSLILVALFLCL